MLTSIISPGSPPDDTDYIVRESESLFGHLELRSSNSPSSYPWGITMGSQGVSHQQLLEREIKAPVKAPHAPAHLEQ